MFKVCWNTINGRFCISYHISGNSHWVGLQLCTICFMTSMNAYVFSYFSSFYFFTFFLFPHLPHLRLAKERQQTCLNWKHVEPLRPVGCNSNKNRLRKVHDSKSFKKKTKSQSKNSAGRPHLLSSRDETKAARDIRLGSSKSAADASFGGKKIEWPIQKRLLVLLNAKV